MMVSQRVVNCIRNGYDGFRNVDGSAMKSDAEWVARVKGMLRAEMSRRQVTYDQLAERLAALGVKDTAVNLRNKVARGGFSAVFLIQCLAAMGCEVRITDAAS